MSKYIFSIIFVCAVCSASSSHCGSEVRLFTTGTESGCQGQEPSGINQGPPGKRGPHGKQGEPGVKGEAGEKGEKVVFKINCCSVYYNL